MKILVACEFTGTVREALRARGHDAWSCDLENSERGGLHHYRGDIRRVLEITSGWDLMIAFPPCTYLASSGARWWQYRGREQEQALKLVRYLMEANVPRIAIENPVGCISTHIRKPDQIIQPWQFGHGETKTTCLWLKGLPKLVPTNIVKGRQARIHRMPASPGRSKERSRTYQGIADAMADQWTLSSRESQDG